MCAFLMINKIILLGLVAVSFVAGSIMTGTMADALSPWANDMLERIGILETRDISSFYTVTETVIVPFETNGSVHPACDGGDIVTGGGYFMPDSEASHLVIGNRPDASNAWGVTLVSGSGAGPVTLTGYAICADITP